MLSILRWESDKDYEIFLAICRSTDFSVEFKCFNWPDGGHTGCRVLDLGWLKHSLEKHPSWQRSVPRLMDWTECWGWGRVLIEDSRVQQHVYWAQCEILHYVIKWALGYHSCQCLKKWGSLKLFVKKRGSWYFNKYSPPVKYFPEVKTAVFLRSINCAGGLFCWFGLWPPHLAVFYLRNLSCLLILNDSGMLMSFINPRCSCGKLDGRMYLECVQFVNSREFQAVFKKYFSIKL